MLAVRLLCVSMTLVYMFMTVSHISHQKVQTNAQAPACLLLTSVYVKSRQSMSLQQLLVLPAEGPSSAYPCRPGVVLVEVLHYKQLAAGQPGSDLDVHAWCAGFSGGSTLSRGCLAEGDSTADAEWTPAAEATPSGDISTATLAARRAPKPTGNAVHTRGAAALQQAALAGSDVGDAGACECGVVAGFGRASGRAGAGTVAGLAMPPAGEPAAAPLPLSSAGGAAANGTLGAAGGGGGGSGCAGNGAVGACEDAGGEGAVTPEPVCSAARAATAAAFAATAAAVAALGFARVPQVGARAAGAAQGPLHPSAAADMANAAAPGPLHSNAVAGMADAAEAAAALPLADALAGGTAPAASHPSTVASVAASN